MRRDVEKRDPEERMSDAETHTSTCASVYVHWRVVVVYRLFLSMYAVVVSESNYDNMPVHVRDSWMPLVLIGLVVVLVLSCKVNDTCISNILRISW